MAAWRARRNHGRSKVDFNQREIVGAFRKLGAGVFDLSSLGCGVPDLMVCARGETWLVEVKNAETRYGKRGLNPLQKEWAEIWQGGPVYIVYTVDDVVALMTGAALSVRSYGGYETNTSFRHNEDAA